MPLSIPTHYPYGRFTKGWTAYALSLPKVYRRLDSLRIVLILDRRQHQLHLTQVRHRVAQDERKVVAQIHLNGRAQARALCKQNKVLQLEQSLDNLRGRSRLRHLHRRVVLAHDRLLLSKIALAAEDEVGARRGDLHVELLTQRIHVAADLLQIQARHVDDVIEVHLGDLDLVDVGVKELEEVVRHRRLLRVLHADSELVRVGRRQVERQRIVITHRLDELEQIDHVNTKDVLGRAKVVLEAISMQAEVYKNRVGLIDGHHLQTGGVELEVSLRQNLLQSLDESAEGACLDCADLEEVAVNVRLSKSKGGTHLYAGAVPSLSKWPRSALSGAALLGATSVPRNFVIIIQAVGLT